ncbi:MAG: YjbQ family protein [Bryobacterales bacterium]|nr:YjbQ family protein [Bryobacterales bacterium]
MNIAPKVEAALRKSGIAEGMILVSAMHITAGVLVNDAEDVFRRLSAAPDVYRHLIGRTEPRGSGT